MVVDGTNNCLDAEHTICYSKNFTFLETMQICDGYFAAKHNSAGCQFCIETKYVVC